MQTDIITFDGLERLSNFIGEGSEGKIFGINNELVYKIYYGIYGGLLKSFNPKISTYDKEISEELHEKLSLLSEKRKYVYHTTLPIGEVVYNNLTIGAILKYRNNHDTLLKYYLKNTLFVLKVYKILSECNNELCQNNIYQTDYHPGNVLIDLNSSWIDLIDVDGQYVHVTNIKDESLENDSYVSLRDSFLDYLKLKISPELELIDGLKSLNINDKLIDILLSSELDFGKFHYLINSLMNNEYLLKSKCRTLKK